jgi:hypothetical protein
VKRTLIFSLAAATLCLALAPHLAAQTARGPFTPGVRSSSPAVARAGEGQEPVPGLRGFGVVLVQGDMQTGQSTADVPAAALKALNDLKDFLPYKSYKLLDSQWTIGSGRLTGRLRGPENAGYDFELQARRGEDVPLVVSRFVLRSSDSLQERTAALQSRGRTSQTTGELPQARLFAELGLHRNLIDTSFSMDLGETVVVGTSRLQGNTALIVLLTAVKKAQ